MLRFNNRSMKLYENEGGGSGVLKLSASGLTEASANYAACAKKILTELTGSDTFDGNIENATGGIAGQIKKLQTEEYWVDAQGTSFNTKASEALEQIKNAAIAINTNAQFLEKVAGYVGEVTEEVQGKVDNLIGTAGTE